VTLSSAYEVGGSIATAAGKKVSFATGCLTDSFSLTGPGGSVPPTICGTNTGEHSKSVNRKQSLLYPIFSKFLIFLFKANSICVFFQCMLMRQIRVTLQPLNLDKQESELRFHPEHGASK
jgi:hypothetical protein